jgi:hypothetical protein
VVLVLLIRDALQSAYAALQAPTDAVTSVMAANLLKLENRESNLNEMDQSATRLGVDAARFQKTATKLKRKWWWMNCAWGTVAIIIGTIVVTAVVVTLVILL